MWHIGCWLLFSDSRCKISTQGLLVQTCRQRFWDVHWDNLLATAHIGNLLWCSVQECSLIFVLFVAPGRCETEETKWQIGRSFGNVACLRPKCRHSWVMGKLGIIGQHLLIYRAVFKNSIALQKSTTDTGLLDGKSSKLVLLQWM